MEEASAALAVIIKLESHRVSEELNITFRPSVLAPNTYDEVKSEFRSIRHTKLPYRVATSNCDTTIFGDQRTNLALRFWHDSVHVLSGHDFTPLGERASAQVHMDVLERCYGISSNSMVGRLMWIDCNGQYRCLEEIGAFPEDQQRFAVNALRVGLKDAIKHERLVQRFRFDG